ncbi:MAG TPA: LUD domain-containing protein [Chloroflexota bacterium]|nr:LUD domain-containing protein [Chloroflexota bacterium]
MATVLTPNRAWARLASDEQITLTAAALETNGMRAIVVETGDEARHQVFTLLPAGAQVLTMTSRTLETIGVAEEINEPPELAEARRYDAVRPKLLQMDMKTQWPEMRRLGASPEYAIGSVHAVSEQGEVFVASASGSQLAAYVYGAGAVIWVVGSQKIVPDREAAFKRIEEYSLPREDERAREAYGIGSAVNKVLVVNREFMAGRITVILVKQELGF